MAKIHPFKAVRPTRDKAHLVATRPLASYKKHILQAKLEENPYTFLHIIHPEVDKNHTAKPNTKERFEAVRSRFDEFVEEGVLIQDELPTIYVYRQTKGKHVFTGIIAGASVAEYENDLIKKHEATLTSREEMFTNYLDLVGFNAEPVLMSHEPSEEINSILNKKIIERPDQEFTNTDKIKHEIWVLTQEESIQIQQAFEQIPAFYIADGHHRSASSVRLCQKMRERGFNHPNQEYYLAFIMNESQLNILEYNRVVLDWKGTTKEEFLQNIGQVFEVTSLSSATKPTQEHELTMCVEGDWFKLNVPSEKIDTKHPVNCLDAQLLTDYVLTPLLGISDLKTDKSIHFTSGADGIEEIERLIHLEEAVAGFVLYPVEMKQVKKVADHQMIMPPKSTWVEPKIRSGLTIYMIQE